MEFLKLWGCRKKKPDHEMKPCPPTNAPKITSLHFSSYTLTFSEIPKLPLIVLGDSKIESVL